MVHDSISETMHGHINNAKYVNVIDTLMSYTMAIF